MPALSPGRPRKPKPTNLHRQLLDAWAEYRRSTRPLWNYTIATERRLLRTLDTDAYARERRLIVQRQVSTWEAWVASVKRILGREARVEVIARGPTELPECALARGPNADSLMMDDYIVGRPRPSDRAALEKLAASARGRVMGPAAKSRTDVWYEKMVKALAEAREKAALKAYALQKRSELPRDHEAWEYWAKRSYLAQGRADRCMRRATAYKNKLAAAGLVYDMTQIQTPVTLPEELNGDPTENIHAHRNTRRSQARGAVRS